MGLSCETKMVDIPGLVVSVMSIVLSAKIAFSGYALL